MRARRKTHNRPRRGKRCPQCGQWVGPRGGLGAIVFVGAALAVVAFLALAGGILILGGF